MNMMSLLNGAVYGACGAVLVNETVSAVVAGAIVGVVCVIVYHHTESRGVRFDGKDTFWSI